MPLSFDMPLKQLKTYNGTNPKPLDWNYFGNVNYMKLIK